jgi:pantetheine-phosphate adenylyltransferase
MKRIGVFPGSFDPFTKGHEDIVKRFLPLLDEVIIAIGVNESKKYMHTLDSRITHIQSLFENEEKVAVDCYSKLTVDFCKEKGAQYLLRGLRNAVDADYERSIAQMNIKLAGIETLILMTNTEYAPISSSIIREIKKNNGDISEFVTNSEQLIIN